MNTDVSSHRLTAPTVQPSSAGASWLPFPGGELEGRRPRVMCPACRQRAERTATLCFQCYRSELDRERAIRRAGELQTASAARFQEQLPFAPVNRPRLERLRVARAASRQHDAQSVSGPFVARLRQAQIAARRALQQIAATSAAARTPAALSALASATHAAELQLPEAWLPFVVSR